MLVAGDFEWDADSRAVLFYQPSQALQSAVCCPTTPYHLQPVLLHFVVGPILVGNMQQA